MPYSKKTKIIATLGPASNNPQTIKELIKSGVNVFRFNMKHGTIAWHEENIARVQDVAKTLEKAVGILIDLQGPEIRIKINEEIKVKKGQEIKFTSTLIPDEESICIPHHSVIKSLVPGDKFTIDDGYIRFVVTKKFDNYVLAGSLDDTTIKPNKGLNLVGKDIELPSLIDDDIEKLHLATKKQVDFIALSFVRTKKDIETLRKIMKTKGIEAQVVSKLESQKGLDHMDEIIDASDAVMVARGDLGIEVPIEQLAFHQKNIIIKCRKAHKQVIVATQMLQSMIESPLPTRAEATDIANAVFDGTDAVMLSGETATGSYPLKAVEIMNSILVFNEQQFENKLFDIEVHNQSELIVKAAEEISAMVASNKLLNIDFIVVLTETGYTAKVVSSFRPKIPIIAITPRDKVVEMLTLTYGVKAIQAVFPPSGRVISPESVIEKLKSESVFKRGQNIILIHGQHWQKPGTTNAMVLMRVE